MEAELDPEHNLKKVTHLFGLGTKLHNLYKQNRSKTPQKTKEEIEEEQLAEGIEDRKNRIDAFGPIQEYIFSMVAKHYNCDVNEIIDGIADSDDYSDLLKSFCSSNGHSMIVFIYGKFKYPGRESGRYDPDKENSDIMRVVCSDGDHFNYLGDCVAIYRLQTEYELDMKNITEDVLMEELNVEQSETLKSAIQRLVSDLNLPPNIQKRKDKPQPGENKIKRIEYELSEITNFVVSHTLYKGRLLVPHQIKETSCKRELVEEVKFYFARWIQQINIMLVQDMLITRDSNNVGPRDELKY